MMLFLCMQMLMAAPVESPIRLAAQLAKDGEIARAESVLLDIDVEHQTRDVVLLHVTLGLIALKKDLPREALKNFIQARELFSEKTEGIEKDSILVYIAQCHLMLEEPKEALSVLKEYQKDRAPLSNIRMRGSKKKEVSSCLFFLILCIKM